MLVVCCMRCPWLLGANSSVSVLVVLCMRCLWPLGACSPACTSRVFRVQCTWPLTDSHRCACVVCSVCNIRGLQALVHRCACLLWGVCVVRVWVVVCVCVCVCSRPSGRLGGVGGRASRVCVCLHRPGYLAESGKPAFWARSGAPGRSCCLWFSFAPQRAWRALFFIFTPHVSLLFGCFRSWVPWASAPCGWSLPTTPLSSLFLSYFGVSSLVWVPSRLPRVVVGCCPPSPGLALCGPGSWCPGPSRVVSLLCAPPSLCSVFCFLLCFVLFCFAVSVVLCCAGLAWLFLAATPHLVVSFCVVSCCVMWLCTVLFFFCCCASPCRGALGRLVRSCAACCCAVRVVHWCSSSCPK